MTALVMLLLLLASPPASLEQIRSEVNPEHRAKAAVEFALAAEKSAEAAYGKGDQALLTEELKNVQESVKLAQDSFAATGRSPGRHPGPYKYAELRSRELLIRLSDLQQRMDANEREVVEPVKNEVQKIHDAWFEGIMGRAK